MDFVSGKNQKKCQNNKWNTFCNKKHYIKNSDGELFIINVDDFFEICRHHRALVQARCNIVCPSDIECSMHFKLKRLEMYKSFVLEKNLNENKIFKKIAFHFNKDVAQSQEAFWWTDILEWELVDVPPGAAMRWRSHYL